METTNYVKKLLRAAWPNLYLSQVAALLSCNYGTAYRCLEEAGCFQSAPAGKPPKSVVEILEWDPDLVKSLAARKITARRYFNCIGCDISMVRNDSANEVLIDNLTHDFPELYELPPTYYSQKPIRLDLALTRGKNGVPSCYSQTYYGILGRGKTDASALYHAKLSFQQLSHKGRLELFLEEGFEAALRWEPMKRSEVRFKPELQLEPDPPPPTVAEMRREIQALSEKYKTIPANGPENNQRRQQLTSQVSRLQYEIMQIEDPERFALQSRVRDLTNKVATSREAIHRVSGKDFERFQQLEKVDIDLKDQLKTAQRALDELLATRRRSQA